MVNQISTEQRAAERALAISYAPPAARRGLEALLALDDVLGATLRSTREPLLGQIRLTWWHDALVALDGRPPPAEPVLAALAAHVLPFGVSGAMLAASVDGWEALLADPLDEEAMRRFAQGRGATMFALVAAILGGPDEQVGQVEQAGEGWALGDLALHLSDRAAAGRAATVARQRLDAAFARRWHRAMRPLGALALLALADLRDIPVGSPRRVGRLLRHRLTGG